MTHDTLIDEPVAVWAFFDHGIFPIAILWRRRLVKFQKLIFITSRRLGEKKIVSLVCASDGANYELELNCENHLWKLMKVMPLD